MLLTMGLEYEEINLAGKKAYVRNVDREKNFNSLILDILNLTKAFLREAFCNERERCLGTGRN